MSSARRQPGANGKAAPGRPGGTRKAWSNIAMGMFLLPVMAVLLPTSIVLGVLMLPTLAAGFVGRGRARMLAATVGMLNFAGCVPPLVELWGLGHTLAATGEVLGEPLMWFGPYLAAAFGWMIFLTIPPLVHRYYETVTNNRLSALRKHQDRLREEWGDEVAGDEAAADDTSADKAGEASAAA
ncbi:hypothetical protein [Ferruginivarius sediminum]|nr:hypothetical protein [Ferruginivarius sediminum]